MHDNVDFLNLRDELRRARNESLDVRRQFEDIEHLLIDFLNNNPALSFIKDENGRYLYASKSFAEFFNVEQSAFLGKTDFEWLPENLARQFTENDERVRATGEATEIIESVPRPGGVVHSIVYKFPVSTPSGRRFLGGIAVDITERLAAEEKIERLNHQLEARIAQLAQANADLKKARDHALKASSVKSTFLAHVSHELRTPVAAIMSSNELLLTSELAGDQRELATVVQTSASVLLHLVNDILDLSAIEAGSLTIKCLPFDPAQVVAESVQEVREIARDKGLELITTLDAELPTSGVGDPVRIQQVLRNLLANAVKYTNEGSIRASARVVDRDDQCVQLEFAVEDTGIGISETDMPLLFRPFSQIDSGSTRKYGGTGLGLAISKQIVELMGGTITVASSPGRGSTFSFVVPARIEPVATSPSPEGSQEIPLPADKYVLVVEDNPVMQKLLLMQLSILGVRADLAADGREALEAIKNVCYDLVLMDCHLPNLDGYDTSRELRRLEATTGKHLPIVAITASAMKGDKERCLAAGMDDHLSKPVSIEQLKRAIQAWAS